MTRPASLPINLNTILAVLTITGMVASGVYFFAPLKTLPEDIRGVQKDMGEMKQAQAVQAKAMDTLADITKENRDLRRDFDRSDAERKATDQIQDQRIDSVMRDVERLKK